MQLHKRRELSVYLKLQNPVYSLNKCEVTASSQPKRVYIGLTGKEFKQRLMPIISHLEIANTKIAQFVNLYLEFGDIKYIRTSSAGLLKLGSHCGDKSLIGHDSSPKIHRPTLIACVPRGGFRGCQVQRATYLHFDQYTNNISILCLHIMCYHSNISYSKKNRCDPFSSFILIFLFSFEQFAIK